MSPAFIHKTFRDYLLLWTAATAALLAFVIFYMLATDAMPLERTAELFEIPWVRRFVSAMIGSDLLESLTPNGIASLAFSHPLMWTLLLGFALTIASGVLADEMDRGTMDLLATLPVSRARMYGSLTCVVLAMGLPMCWTIWVGTWIGRHWTGNTDVSLAVLALLPWHLYAAYVFVACLALGISAMCNRRGWAVAITFAVIFYAFVLNVIAVFWEPARKIAFTGFLHYYAPLPIVRDQAWKWGNIATLLAAAAVCWLAGLIVFRCRDIPAR